MSYKLMWDATFCFHFPHTGVVNVGNVKRTLLAHFDQSLWLFFRAPEQESELEKSPNIWWNCDLSCLKWKQMRVVGYSYLGQTLVVVDQYNCWENGLSLNSDELLKLCAELLQMRIESRDCCSVLGSSRPTRHHHLQWRMFERSKTCWSRITFSLCKADQNIVHWTKLDIDQRKLSHRVELIRAVDRLVEPEPVDEVTFHLKRINIRERLLSPGKTKI